MSADPAAAGVCWSGTPMTATVTVRNRTSARERSAASDSTRTPPTPTKSRGRAARENDSRSGSGAIPLVQPREVGKRCHVEVLGAQVDPRRGGPGRPLGVPPAGQPPDRGVCGAVRPPQPTISLIDGPDVGLLTPDWSPRDSPAPVNS